MTDSNSLNFQDRCFHIASSLTGDPVGELRSLQLADFPIKLNSNTAVMEQDVSVDWPPEE